MIDSVYGAQPQKRESKISSRRALPGPVFGCVQNLIHTVPQGVVFSLFRVNGILCGMLEFLDQEGILHNAGNKPDFFDEAVDLYLQRSGTQWKTIRE